MSACLAGWVELIACSLACLAQVGIARGRCFGCGDGYFTSSDNGTWMVTSITSYH